MSIILSLILASTNPSPIPSVVVIPVQLSDYCGRTAEYQDLKALTKAKKTMRELSAQGVNARIDIVRGGTFIGTLTKERTSAPVMKKVC